MGALKTSFLRLVCQPGFVHRPSRVPMIDTER
jgi:hypothetical protein